MDNFYHWGQAFLDLPFFWQWGGIFIFGICIGSFLNVVIYRLPIMLENDWKIQSREYLNLIQPESIETIRKTEEFNLNIPRSHCPNCQKKLNIKDNIPIISYLLLQGRCRYCQKNISSSYFFVELLSGLISVFIFMRFGATLQSFATIGFAFALIALAMIDIRHQLLPDIITLPLIWAGLILSLGQINGFNSQTAIIGAVLGYLSLWLIIVGFHCFFKKEGMGLGDAKLLAAIMAWIDVQYLPYVLLLACCSGLFITVILRLKNQQALRNNPVAFGPYLAFAGLMAKLFI